MDRLPSHRFVTVKTQKNISKLAILGSQDCGSAAVAATAAKQPGNLRNAEQANTVFRSKLRNHQSTSVIQQQNHSLLPISQAGWSVPNSTNLPVVPTRGEISNEATPRPVNCDVILFQKTVPTRNANPSHSAVGVHLLGVIDSSTTAAIVSGPTNNEEASCGSGSGSNDNTNPAPLASRSASAHRPYHDYLIHASFSGKVERRRGRGGVVSTFPEQLHRMLEDAEGMGFEDIVSWQPHGRAFMVRDKARFMRDVMPKYFNQSLFASFRRQLNLYGFVRIQGGGHFDRGAYYHELCLRGMPALATYIQRSKKRKANEESQSAPSTQAQPSSMTSSCSRSEDLEPNFNDYQSAPRRDNESTIAKSAFQERKVATLDQAFCSTHNFLASESPALSEPQLADKMGGQWGQGTPVFGRSTHQQQEYQPQENETLDFHGPVDVTTSSSLIAIQQRMHSRESSGGQEEEELPPFIRNLMQSLPCAAEILMGLDFE